MSTQDPSGPEPEADGKPSFDKQPPVPGTPSGAPSDPYGTPPPPPPDGSPYDNSGEPGGYGAPYGGPPPGYGSPYASGPGAGPGPGPVPGMPPLGGWPNRILALVIDYLLVQIVAVVVVLPFASLGNQSGYVSAVWLGYGLFLVYDGLMLSRDGQTIGKKVMKIRVAMLIDGSSPTNAAAWTRAATFILPALICCWALWWSVDGVFGVFDKPYRQCIHDKAAKTVVVSTA